MKVLDYSRNSLLFVWKTIHLFMKFSSSFKKILRNHGFICDFCPVDSAETWPVVTCRMLSVVRLHDDHTVKTNSATGGFITQEF